MQRKIGTASRLLACVSVIVAATGCGGGGNNPGQNPQQAQQTVETGRQQINAILAGTPTEANLQQVVNTFNTARAQAPNNAQAQFGFAISSVALQAQALINRIQGRAAGAETDALDVAASRGTLWNVSSPDAGLSANTLRLALTAPLSAAMRSRAVAPNQIRTALDNLKTTLDTAIPLVESVANQSGFTFQLTDRNGTFTIDQGDAQSFLSGLYIVRAITNMALAYDFNWGTFDFGQSINAKFGATLIDGALIGPNDYLPPLPFGTLLSDGAARFAAAKQDLSTAADKALVAVDMLTARTDTTRHLVDATTINATTAKDTVNTYKADLSQSFQVNSDGIQQTFNPNAWFTQPPTSLRALMPTYHVIGESDPFLLQTSPNDYPDKTFGGLRVNPSDDMYHTEVFSDSAVSALLIKL
ncbi:MAG TPA: hypothetical protein VFB21_21105 [Chthonomonadaceae bacterium]|nr:hypothetical protein [Chthonomonadaceae bacterium]